MNNGEESGADDKKSKKVISNVTPMKKKDESSGEDMDMSESDKEQLKSA
jgi:hypothetical protein